MRRTDVVKRAIRDGAFLSVAAVMVTMWALVGAASVAAYDGDVEVVENGRRSCVDSHGRLHLPDGTVVLRDGSVLLPRWRTAEEKEAARKMERWLEPLSRYGPPPSGTVLTPAEFDSCVGVLFCWPTYPEVMLGVAENLDPDMMLWVHAETQWDTLNCRNYLVGHGVSMANVRFIIAPSDAPAIRDYGPISVDEDGGEAVVDLVYDRYGRWQDDKFPISWASYMGWPNYRSPVNLEGGNFMTDGRGAIFTSSRIYTQNEDSLTWAQVDQEMYNYFHYTTFTTVPHTVSIDGTGHIDMYAKLLDRKRVLVSEHPNPNSTIGQQLNQVASIIDSMTNFYGEPYEVTRIPMQYSEEEIYYTYTNSLILNNQVFVPVFGISLDSQALAMYDSLLPNHEIIEVDCSGSISAGGAVHCLSMQVSAPFVPDPVEDLNVHQSGNNLLLNWNLVYGATSYDVYSDSSAYFAPSVPVASGVILTAWADAGAAGDPGQPHYYLVRANAQSGETSRGTPSRVGAVAFGLDVP